MVAAAKVGKNPLGGEASLPPRPGLPYCSARACADLSGVSSHLAPCSPLQVSRDRRLRALAWAHPRLPGCWIGLGQGLRALAPDLLPGPASRCPRGDRSRNVGNKPYRPCSACHAVCIPAGSLAVRETSAQEELPM
jgi:hypothetical protein